MSTANAVKYKNILYAGGIVAIWTAFVFFTAYPDRQGLGTLFSVTIYFILTLFVAIGLGLITLCLRLLKLIKQKSLNFLYMFAGVLAVIVGTIGLLSVGLNGVSEHYYLRLFVLSLCLGIIIIFDNFFLKKEFSRTL